MKTTREFLQTLEVGDILKVGSSIRVLRFVRWKQYSKHYPPTASFGFAIRRKSWTGKGYTFYNSSDLMRMGVTLVSKGHVNSLEVEKRLHNELQDRSYKVRAEEVIGIID